MAALRERNSPLQLMGRRLILAALAVAVVSLAWGVWNIYRKGRESGRLNSEAQAQFADLEAQQAKLEASLGALQTERGKEEALREQYALGKQGEGLIVIVEPQNATSQRATSTLFEKLKKAFTWW